MLSSEAARWVNRSVGSAVRGVTALSGGYSSRMLLLDLRDRREVVLRQLHQEPWRRHSEALLNRETDTQRLLADSVVPVPRPLALDPDGSQAGDPSLLMTRLPGRIDLVRQDAWRLSGLGALLVRIHEVEPPAGRWPRDYQSWATEAKRHVPPWSRDDGLYAEAFARLAEPAPAYDRTFLHRDFQPGNVLWTGDEATGVVDWVETSTGPADIDVAHCSANLATLHGAEVGHRFRAAYLSAGGTLAAEPDAAAYWQLLDLVGFLPAAGRESGTTPETMRTTWAANGRGDLDVVIARDRREDLLRLVLRG